MEELSPDARALLRAEGPRVAPDRQARARIHSRLMASVAAGSVTLAAHAAEASLGFVAAGAIVGTKTTTSLMGSALLYFAVGVGVGAVVVPAAHTAIRAAQPAAPTSAHGTAAHRSFPAERPHRVPPPPTPVSPLPSSADTFATSSGPEGGLAPAPSALRSLAEETRLLQAAQRALQEGRASQSLDLLDRYAREHKSGALREEALAAKALALCAAQRLWEGRVVAVHFEQGFPNSPLLPRVRAACAERGAQKKNISNDGS